jgi:DNA-3-methyladenine glycosylase
MTRRRGVADPRLLCAGPGRLCQALGITLREDGGDLTLGEGLWIAPGRPARDPVVTLRVGLSVAIEQPWRFVLPGTRYASRPLPRVPVS